MSVLGKMFAWATWWNGTTLGTAIGLRRAKRVGSDATGNVYFTGKPLPDGRERRFVRYAGANDSSRVPPEWHGWLHHQYDGIPDATLPPARRWEKEAKANMTGTSGAYSPAGSLERGGKRAAATGDYEAWVPDAA
jgi:NADH:ubiquinone oxidoreductase subunit